MDSNQTLKDALIEAGDKAQVALLTAEAQNLTKQEIIDLINGSAKENLQIGTLNSLQDMALARMKKGEKILPWKSMSGIKKGKGGLGGGFW